MGFFKDFKRDFAQAVNELMPDKDELAAEYDDEDMVNTFDETDDIEVAPEDIFEDLDEIKIDAMQDEALETFSTAEPMEEEPEELEDEQDIMASIPDAEVISEPTESIDEAADDISMMIQGQEPVEQEVEAIEEITEPVDEALSKVDLNHDVLTAIKMREEQEEQQEENNTEHEEVSMIAEDIKVESNEIESIVSEDTTYVTKGTIINGDIETDGGIDIIGTVNGNVVCGGKLIIGGTINGNVNAGEIYANASKIEGEITSDGSIKIGVGSVVVGNISATSAVIAGAVNGDIDVHGPVIVDSTAVIMGNIKSRSVQINNGAVIEGFCSQCYSEIDVKSFFG